tara:strand:+ start:625 stop:912 length:288 start_codon:yes stop_codon:yes gene_type:complete
MKENLIKTLQKFLNNPFTYAELFKMLDKQKDFLLQDKILNTTEEAEYNALWDTIGQLETKFKFGDKPKVIIGTETSVTRMFDLNLKQRRASLKVV